MAGIGVLLNRNAGRKGMPFRGRVGEKLAFVLGDPDSLRETSRIEQIEDVIRYFAEREIDILGISGGDGSNHYVLDTCHRVYGEKPLPRVAFLCGGTHNAHARSIGVQGTPEKLLQAILRKYHTRARFDLTHRVLLSVDDGVRVHCGFSLGAGFLCRFYEELVRRRDDSPAKVAALLGSWVGSLLVGGRRIKRIFELEPARVFFDDQVLGWPAINAFSASGMERLGLGFIPYPRASETPATFQGAALKIRPSAVVRLLWSFKRGVVPRHPAFFSDICQRMVVEAERPISYVFDGELFRGGRRMEISVARRVELIVC